MEDLRAFHGRNKTYEEVLGVVWKTLLVKAAASSLTAATTAQSQALEANAVQAVQLAVELSSVTQIAT